MAIVGDPVAGAALLGLLAAPLGALRARDGHRIQGAVFAAVVAAAAAALLASGPPGVAAGTGAFGALLLGGSLGGWQRGTFDGAFGRSAFGGGRGEAVLARSLSRAVPSARIDPTARLRLERAVIEIEEKSAAELFVTVVRRCDAYDGVRWRFAAWLALTVGAAAATVPGAPGALGWCGTALGGALGSWLGGLGFIERPLLPRKVLEEAVAEAAWDAFAHAGLTRTPGRAGVLVFAALFERRVVVLGDEGIDRHRSAEESWQDAADAVAAETDLAAGLEAGIRACGTLIARHAAPREGPPADGEPPIRIQD